jgi:hypothetical protein
MLLNAFLGVFYFLLANLFFHLHEEDEEPQILIFVDFPFVSKKKKKKKFNKKKLNRFNFYLFYFFFNYFFSYFLFSMIKK